MAAFTTMAIVGLMAASAYAKKKQADAGAAGTSLGGQTGAELLSGKGPTGAELAGAGAAGPAATTITPGVPTPPDAALADYNAMASGRAAANKQRARAAGQSSILGGGAPSALTGTAAYAPRTLLGS